MKRSFFGATILVIIAMLSPGNAYAWGVFGVCLFACVDADVDTSDLPKAAEQLKDAADSLGKNLKAATDNLDPLALKKLLDENEDLRTSVTGLRAQLSALPYFDPVVVLQDQELRLVVTKSSGEFELNAWIDSRDNWIIQSKIIENVEPPQLNVVNDNIITAACVAHYDKFEPNYAVNFMQDITEYGVGTKVATAKSNYCRRTQNMKRAAALEIVKEAQGQFRRYVNGLRTSNPTGAAGSVQMTMNQVLGTLGAHTIYVEVKPLAPNSVGTWQLSGELQIVASEKNRRTIKTFDVDHRITPNHTMGDSLPTVEATITVAAPN